MTSIGRPWISRFAHTLKKGDVFATNRLGENRMVVLSEPQRIKNLTGSGKFVVLDVRLLDSGDEGQMVYRDYNTVFPRPEN